MPTTPQPGLGVVLRGRCPNCGTGPLFSGLLDIRPTCRDCGLDLSAYDAGDGPAVAAIFVVGALAMIGAFLVEFRLEPPLWVHAVIWPLLVLPTSLAVMRIAKSALIYQSFHHRRA
ncbi:uncharacterized protein (DUF983 family) [Humitalea rosea]|uniref:Uncharacterized protein (DUF983 family) n=1 Tax=Humitalea rosea TaxID=990373 RepID=A0A2W7K6N8_9PROT|nr:uncharacterized protein (DUF983 family) [Humitalea rosea]